MFYIRCIHRCNQHVSFAFACSSTSSGLQPRLTARPRPRPQTESKSMKKHWRNIRWRHIVWTNALKKMNWSYYHFTRGLYAQSFKNTFKMTPPKTPKVTPNGSFLTPWSHLGTFTLPKSLIPPKFDSSRSPKDTHLDPHGIPETQQKLQKSIKNVEQMRSGKTIRTSHKTWPSQTSKSSVLL